MDYAALIWIWIWIWIPAGQSQRNCIYNQLSDTAGIHALAYPRVLLFHFFFFSYSCVSFSSSLRSFLIPSTYRLILVPVIVITGANLGLKQRLISSSSDVPRTLIDATHSPPFLAPFGTVNPLPSVSISVNHEVIPTLSCYHARPSLASAQGDSAPSIASSVASGQESGL